MIAGLIDLGSNTIKYTLYRVEDGAYTSIDYDATFCYLIRMVEDGRLTEEGVERIVQTLLRYHKKLRSKGADLIYCFSTASLRYINNQQEVVDIVLRRTGLRIHLLSGEEEARCNALSMAAFAKEDAFIGGDIGGGSAQLFQVNNTVLEAQISLPIGALKLHQAFVAGVFPTREETRAMREYLRDLLARELPLTRKAPTLYFMGGALRMAATLLGGEFEPFAVADLQKLLEAWLTSPDQAKADIARTVPEREQTIMPAMIAVLAIAEQLESCTIVPTKNSVREGVLMELLQGTRKG